LPSIQHDLDFSQNNLAWVVNAYLIAFGGLLLLAGRVGDLVGRRRVYLIGLAVFTGASLLCALSPSQGMLIAARFVQGVGGALTSAVVLGMIVTMFPEPRDMAKALGVYGFVASAGGSIGLLAGGVLTEAISWHWIFLVNLPVGVLTAVLSIRFVGNDRGIGLRGGVDAVGALLLTAGLMLGVYAILQIGRAGESGRTLGLGALSVVLVVGCLIRQARIANPLIPLRLLRSRVVAGANLAQALTVVGMFGMFFLGALYLQFVLCYGPLEVGLAFLPSTVAMGAMSLRWAGPLAARFGQRSALVAGLNLVLAGVLLFARTPVNANYLIDVLPSMVLLGLGAGLCFPTLATLAMSGATPSDSGLASGLVNTTVQVGGALGLAVLAAVAAGRTDTRLTAGQPQLAALNSGYHLAYLVGAACAAAAIVITLLTIRSTPQPVRNESTPDPVLAEAA